MKNMTIGQKVTFAMVNRTQWLDFCLELLL